MLASLISTSWPSSSNLTTHAGWSVFIVDITGLMSVPYRVWQSVQGEAQGGA
jgi:hypothetical protein